MTTSQPSPRRSGTTRSGRGGAGAVQQQLSQIVTDLKTTVDLMGQTATASRSAATDMAQALKDNRASMDSLINLMSTSAGPAGYGSVRIGGRMTAGPNFGRDYLGQGPRGWPGGSYPGGSSYGMGSQGQTGLPFGGQGSSMGALRNMASNAIHQRFGMGRFSSEDAGTDPESGERRFRLRDSAGNEHGVGTRSQLAQQFGAARLASQVAGGLGGGGLAGAARAVPYVGAALVAADVAYKGASFISNQRQANSAYQSIYGGSNMAGLGQRFQQEGFALGSLFSGGMPAGQARQAFQAVSAMGYQGGQRSDRLGFVQSNYKSMGMSANDSLQLVALSAQNLTTSLSDLHDQLQSVSKMAKQTGQSAQVMRQAFTQNLAAATASGAGVNSGTTAQALTASTVGMGRSTAQLNYNGMINSTTRLDITAANAGYTSGGQLVQAMATNPLALPQAIDRNIQQSLQSQVPAAAMASIVSQIKAAGGPDAILGYGGDSIANRIGVSIADQIDPTQIDAVNAAYGIDTSGITDVQAKYGSLVKEIAKQQNGGVTAEARKSENKRTAHLTGAAAQKAFQAAGGVVGSNTDTGSLAGIYTPTTDAQRKANPTIGGFTTTSWDKNIAAMEKDIGKNGLVKVQTAKGAEIVTLAEASAHFRDQLANGTAELVSGENPGAKIADIYGKETNTGYKDTTHSKTAVPSALGKYASKGPKKGEAGILGMSGISAADLQKISETERKKGDSAAYKEAQKLSKETGVAKGKNSIALYMKPELARWLGVDTTGDVVNQTSTAGAPISPSTYGPTSSTTGGS